MSGTDYRALCAELLDEVAARPLILDRELINRARAALAQPKPEAVGPSDEELLELWKGWNLGWDPQKGTVLMPHPVEYARAVLARWGSCQGILDSSAAPTPAEREVAELVAALRSQAIDCTCDHLTSGDLRRAADLLERQAAPVLEPALARINDILNDSGRILQTDELEALELARRALEQRQAAPVPVAERLPGVEDRDHEECCWWFYPETTDTLAVWVLGPGNAEWLISNPPPPTHWLPATALPLPSGEVKP